MEVRIAIEDLVALYTGEVFNEEEMDAKFAEFEDMLDADDQTAVVDGDGGSSASLDIDEVAATVADVVVKRLETVFKSSSGKK